jgi:hypothetical protein
MKNQTIAFIAFLTAILFVFVTSGIATACYTDGGSCDTVTWEAKADSVVINGNENANFPFIVDGNMTSNGVVTSCGGSYTYYDYTEFCAAVVLPSGGTGILYVDVGQPYKSTTYVVCYGGNDAPTIQDLNTTTVQITFQGVGGWSIYVISNNYIPPSSETFFVGIWLDPGQVGSGENQSMLTSC